MLLSDEFDGRLKALGILRCNLGSDIKLFKFKVARYFCWMWARFKALNDLVFMSPLDFIAIFYHPKQNHFNIVRCVLRDTTSVIFPFGV